MRGVVLTPVKLIHVCCVYFCVIVCRSVTIKTLKSFTNFYFKRNKWLGLENRRG